MVHPTWCLDLNHEQYGDENIHLGGGESCQNYVLESPIDEYRNFRNLFEQYHKGFDAAQMDMVWNAPMAI